MSNALKGPVNESRLRSSPARKGIGGIDEQGGFYGGGVIFDVAVISRGEALGHDLWIDTAMLSQVSDAINRAPNGVKSRFTHPGLSSDGLGKMVGTIHSARVHEDVVRGDLHLSPAAANSPDGNLRRYVLDLARQHPEAFGMSIAFTRDEQAMKSFQSKHTQRNGGFQSPDGANKQNYPHARLAKLTAVDAVDEPAANPSGLFGRGDGADIIYQTEQVLDYVLGIKSDAPECSAFDIHPTRMKGFFKRYLGERGLRVIRNVNVNFDMERTDELPEALRQCVGKSNGEKLAILKAAGLEFIDDVPGAE